jgi:hypothetical protein
MKQIILNIPENKYPEILKRLKHEFSDIEIRESLLERNIANEEQSNYDIQVLSEKSLAEEWLSDEDNRWDEVL